MGQRQKKVDVTKIGLTFPAPLINRIFCLRCIFLIWVGGGSAGAGQGSKQPPLKQSLGNGLFGPLGRGLPYKS